MRMSETFRAYWLYALGLHETVILKSTHLATDMDKHDPRYLEKCLWVLKRYKSDKLMASQDTPRMTTML